MRKNINFTRIKCGGAALLFFSVLGASQCMALPPGSVLAAIEVSGKSDSDDDSFHVLYTKVSQTSDKININKIEVSKTFASFLPINFPIAAVLHPTPGKAANDYLLEEDLWTPVEAESKLDTSSLDKSLQSIDKNALEFIEGQFKGSPAGIGLLSPNTNQTIFAQDNSPLIRQACRWLLLRGNSVSAKISADNFKLFQDVIVGKGSNAPLELLPLLFQADHVRCFNFLAILDASPELKDRARLNFPYACAELLSMVSLPDVRDSILKLLASKDPRMRLFIARKLADLHTPDSVSLLVVALASNDSDVQYAAIRGIRDLGVSKGIIIQQPSIDTFAQNPQKYISEYADFVKQNSTDLGLSY